MSRFEKFEPGAALKPYIKYFAVSEDEQGGSYKVLPDTSLVMGFQYKGNTAQAAGSKQSILSSYSTTGLHDQYRVFKSSADVGSILVYFNAMGASYFFHNPVNELFSESVSLDNFICQSRLNQIYEQLCDARSDIQRIVIVEKFLTLLLKYSNADMLVKNALKLIYLSKGDIRMKYLAEQLHISQAPLEKRFRTVVGASPKKFASLVRFQSILNSISSPGSLTDAGNEAGYHDQTHFLKDFNGNMPGGFRSNEK